MMDTEKNILVAERESDTRKFIVSSLKKYDCEVICADSGRDALRIVEERLPDLIVSDTELEDVNGYDVCKWIKNEDSPYKDIPLVLVSDRTSLQDRLRGFLAGANKYICKPFSIEDFLDVTNLLITKKKQTNHNNWTLSDDSLLTDGLLRHA
ncbi:MAG: Transcriptional regulatory protein YycF [bacterium ADurb.Bin236]|nr:MAG: Transcriptional regulatory protein YycF [bacterium ADurb.Bin236]